MTITESDLNELLELKKNHDDLQKIFKNQNYESTIQLLKDDNRRKAVEAILAEEDFSRLAKYNHKMVKTIHHPSPPIYFDISALLILEDRYRLLKRQIEMLNFWESFDSILPELCRRVSVALASLRDTPAIEALVLEKINKERELHYTRRSYEDKIGWILSNLGSLQSPQLLISQLLITDRTNTDTIGHICIRENIGVSEYTELFSKLPSRDKLRVLSQPNKAQTPLLLLCPSDLFIIMASTLKAKELDLLLQIDTIFENFITRMRCDTKYVSQCWRLLKNKFTTSTGYSLPDIFPQEQQKSKMDCGFISYSSPPVLIEYLEVYKHRSSKDRFDLMHTRLSGITDKLTEKSRITSKYLELYNFNPDCIKQLVQIYELKKNTCDYLLKLAKNSDNIDLLKRAVDKNTSLGQFFWSWRGIKPLYSKFFSKEVAPDSIKRLRNRIAEIEHILPPVPSAPNLPLAEAIPIAYYS